MHIEFETQATLDIPNGRGIVTMDDVPVWVEGEANADYVECFTAFIGNEDITAWLSPKSRSRIEDEVFYDAEAQRREALNPSDRED